MDERPDYKPRARQEQFMLARLEPAIHQALTQHAPRSGNMLDVGCGRQPFRGWLESRGLRYHGLDTQQNEDGSVRFVCALDGNVEAALREAGPFSFLLCTEVMEHVADWPAAFVNLDRLLAPGGRLLLTCPHLYPLHEEPYDFWRPTIHAVRFFAAKHRLAVVEELQIGDGWDVIATALACVRPKLGGQRWNPLAYLACAAMAVLRSVMMPVLGSRWLRALVRPKSKLYLSNLFVLEKRA